MPLVYVPDTKALFLWGDDAAREKVPELLAQAKVERVELVVPEGRRKLLGSTLPLLETAIELARLGTGTLAALPASFATWALASKLAIELVARERVVPTVSRHGALIVARWAAALSASEDASKVVALARSMPPAAHAVPVATEPGLLVWSPDALLRVYLDAIVDALVRSAHGGPEARPTRDTDSTETQSRRAANWEQRFREALASSSGAFEVRGFAERSLAADLERWSEPAVGARDRLRACFRLELPGPDSESFTLRFLLQSPDDPSLLVLASDVWQARGGTLQRFGRAFRDPEESLLEALGRAARLFAPIERSLLVAKPELLELDPSTAWDFLSSGAAALAEAGFGVIVPGELTATGRRRLRMRLSVGAKSKVAGLVSGTAGLGLDQLLTVDWQAAIGDDVLTARELATLSRQKAALVRYRGAWVSIDPRELSEIKARIAAGPGQMRARDAIRIALTGETKEEGLVATVTASGGFAELLERVKGGAAAETRAPASLRATLRPYQERGLAWLWTLCSLGLGACLADDMGLGKTIQVLAFLLRRLDQDGHDPGPVLLVAPTSVVGNWEREIERFAPSLGVVRHYGNERSQSGHELRLHTGALVVTSYGVLRRDADLLAEIDWGAVVLDEAQNIKNAASATARATRRLRASQRIALTGTPVENRLAELWSILEFANPGILGPLEAFRRDFAVPIERYGNHEAAERLRRSIGPFVLRRLKSDPNVVRDLPEKNEMSVICRLTREQATLYRAVVDEEMRRIESTDGMQRRGRVLALLTALKQICNHPAQYLSESGPLAKRSGKLERATEMLEEALAAGDKALIFTQYREMGERLVNHLERSLGVEVAFLHGGTPKALRDQLVQRFQESARGPRIFVLSLKAGGTGLNLTAATHVFHYDRWWNPAVEDQATDRAYRIGQTRSVQVHKLVCAGTVEEKVADLLEGKRKLASKVVGAGEKWITELPSDELRELFALSGEALLGSDDDDSVDDAKKSRRSKARRRAELRT